MEFNYTRTLRIELIDIFRHEYILHSEISYVIVVIFFFDGSKYYIQTNNYTSVM